jgi:hypothetical protein
MRCCVALWYNTNILEDHAASIFRVKMEAARSLASQHHNPEDLNFTAMKTSNLI